MLEIQRNTRLSMQRGIVMPMVAIAMLVLIAITGLALDMGHVYINKTRLQNALDAAALSAAKTLDNTANTALATAAALSTFNQAVAASGNQELAEINSGDVKVAYSYTLDPFNPGSTPPMFVRVSVDSLTLTSWLIQVLGFANKTMAASAVAGPSPKLDKEACDLIPVIACGDPADLDDPFDPNDSIFGYHFGQPVALKTGSGNKGWAVGPGNYQNIQLDCGLGADCIRTNMAGAYNNCLFVGEGVQTKPGNNVGPNAQGMNTRFGCPPPGCGPLKNELDKYPPDKVTDAGSTGYPNPYGDTYSEYQTDYANQNWDYPNGAENRRVVVVPIGNCTGTTNGQGTMHLLGFGCFFLTEPAAHTGNQIIYGEFIKNCSTTGSWGPNPVWGPGPHEIILYKDFTSEHLDS